MSCDPILKMVPVHELRLGDNVLGYGILKEIGEPVGGLVYVAARRIAAASETDAWPLWARVPVVQPDYNS